MKSIVEGECGGANPLVGLASGYGQSNQRIAPNVSRGINSLMPSSSRGEQLASEFLMDQAARTAQPTSFNMNALSRQLPTSSQSAAALSSTWTKEFNPTVTNNRSNQLASQWASSYQPSMEAAWRQSTATPPMMLSQGPMQMGAPMSSQHGMWSAEFLDKFDNNVTDKGAKPHSMVSSTRNALSLLENREIVCAMKRPLSELAEDWTNEFAHIKNPNHEEELWRKLEGEWTKQREDFIRNGWEQETATHAPYIHQSDNPFMQDNNALRIGDEAMRGGDLERAILAYEAAVQNNPQDASAWCRLGLSHAENEHDEKAIQAFRRALDIDPKNEQALLSLSVSLANECLENDALEQLEKWLASHTGNDPAVIKRAKPQHSSFLDHNDFDRVERLFLSAAGRQTGSGDSELQNALGVLYNLGRNFERAVDSLKLAIATKPTDPRLWNRLGATLANGDRTPEAIAAYREALRLYPGYVRARYNLGISCMHLNSYREAVQHFASALDLQKGGSKEHSAIWGPLRSSAVRCLPFSSSFLPFIDSKDLEGLKRVLATVPPSERPL